MPTELDNPNGIQFFIPIADGYLTKMYRTLKPKLRLPVLSNNKCCQILAHPTLAHQSTANQDNVLNFIFKLKIMIYRCGLTVYPCSYSFRNFNIHNDARRGGFSRKERGENDREGAERGKKERGQSGKKIIITRENRRLHPMAQEADL